MGHVVGRSSRCSSLPSEYARLLRYFYFSFFISEKNSIFVNRVGEVSTSALRKVAVSCRDFRFFDDLILQVVNFSANSTASRRHFVCCKNMQRDGFLIRCTPRDKNANALASQ